MAIILNIDTSTEIATISVSKDAAILHSLDNHNQKEHASFLQPAVKELMQMSELSFKDLNAVSVTAGPGSYTGLRVGMASAKGFCYALSIPLIMVGTLEVMALSAILRYDNAELYNLYCPMIDARRMEVFTAVYDMNLSEIIKPCAMILDENSFKYQLNNKVIFFGSGSEKLKSILKDKNAIIENIKIIPEAMAQLSFRKFHDKLFADLMYAEPLYVKEFFTGS